MPTPSLLSWCCNMQDSLMVGKTCDLQLSGCGTSWSWEKREQFQSILAFYTRTSFIRKYLALSWASAIPGCYRKGCALPFLNFLGLFQQKNEKYKSSQQPLSLCQTSKPPRSNSAGGISPKSWGRALATVTPSGCIGLKSTTFSFHPHSPFWHHFKAISQAIPHVWRVCLTCLVLWPGAARWQCREQGEPCIRGKEAEERCWENKWREEN